MITREQLFEITGQWEKAIETKKQLEIYLTRTAKMGFANCSVPVKTKEVGEEFKKLVKEIDPKAYVEEDMLGTYLVMEWF